MRRCLLAGLGWMLATVGPLAAQTPNETPEPGFFAPLPLEAAPGPNDKKTIVQPFLSAVDDSHSPNHFAPACHEPCIWASTEYLLWWIKSAPVAIPLVTGNNDPSTIAALNEQGTVVLFGAGSKRETNFDPLSGGRVTVGGWLDTDRRFGVEGSGFLLEQGSVLFNASSPGGTTAPVVSIPFNATQPFNNNPAGETALNSGNSPNTVNASITSHLWGAEVNGLAKVFGNANYYVTAVVGFRYLDLIENLGLTDAFLDVGNNGVVRVTDAFGARNQFCGGQLGVRGGWSYGPWFMDATIKVALGDNHETSNINGVTTVTNGAFGFASGGMPGGAFAQPSNSGRHSRDIFAVVPEVNFKVGYQMGQHVRPFVGYNFLYLSEALRPGDQLNRNINPTTNFPFFVAPGSATGAPAPLPGFRGSDFWAQGINFGIEIRY